MNVIYLDQNVVIGLVERAAANERLRATREQVLRMVETRKAIFPYSEVHLYESELMAPDNLFAIGEFWDVISRGYHFIAGKEIRTMQFMDVFHERETRFRPHLVLHHEELKFSESVDKSDRATRTAHADHLRTVVAYWASLRKEQIEGRIRRSEAQTPSRMVIEMLNKILTGDFPSLGEIQSEYNTIASEISWAFRDRGAEEDALFKAIAFMREHALRVPAIAIESVGLECLAEQYASDNRARRSVEKSQLDHDSYDLAAVSNFLPYCAAGISDGNAVTLARTAHKRLGMPLPALFVYRDIQKFSEHLEAMPTPEPETDAHTEVARSPGRTLFLVPCQKDELVQRSQR